MPREWLKDDDRDRGRDHDYPEAEWPDSDPLGDGSEDGDDFLRFDYRRKDRDSMFDGLKQRLDLVAVMITVIIAGVVGYVGIQLMNSTVTSGTGDVNVSRGINDPGNASGFENASADLTFGLEDFFSQLGTVFVVIVLVVIIGYLMLLRGR